MHCARTSYTSTMYFWVKSVGLYFCLVLYVEFKKYVWMFQSIVFFDSKLLWILYLSLINGCSQLEWCACIHSDMSCISNQTLKRSSSNWVYKKSGYGKILYEWLSVSFKKKQLCCRNLIVQCSILCLWHHVFTFLC